MVFQEEGPGKESGPTGLAEKPYGWTSFVIIATFPSVMIVTFPSVIIATFHGIFPDQTGIG